MRILLRIGFLLSLSLYRQRDLNYVYLHYIHYPIHLQAWRGEVSG